MIFLTMKDWALAEHLAKILAATVDDREQFDHTLASLDETHESGAGFVFDGGPSLADGTPVPYRTGYWPLVRINAETIAYDIAEGRSH